MRTGTIGYLAAGAGAALVGGLLWLAPPVVAQQAARPSPASADGGFAQERATLPAPVQGDAPAGATPAPQPPKPGGRDLLELPLEQLVEQPVRVEVPAPAAVPAPAPAAAPGAAALEQVSTTLSRVPERNIEAPGSVYVFSREVIIQRGYRSLAELLQTVPGFTVFHRDLDFVVGVRGLNANDNDKITLLINGQNVNGPHEADLCLNGPINLDNVERVEVIVGPSSFFQQANTLAATINLITRNVEGAEVVAAVGDDLNYSTTVMAGHRWAKDEFINFSFTTEQLTGFDAWRADGNPGTSGLVGRRLTGELDQPNYFSVLNGQYGELYGQAIAYRTDFPELHIDNGAPPPINDGHWVEQFYSVFLKDEHPLGATLTSVTRVEATLREQTRLNDAGTGLGPTVPAVDAVQQSIHQWVYRGETYLRYTGFAHHAIQTGVQVETDRNFDNFFSFNNPSNNENYLPTTLFHRDVTGVGFYADDEYQVTDRVKLIGGVREDHNDKLPGDKWFTGARAAVLVQPTEHWFAKVLYNRAVRMPDDLEALNSAWGRDRVVPSTSPFPSGAPFGPPNPPSFTRDSLPPEAPEILSTVEMQNTFYIGKARLGTTFYHEELQDFISFFSPHANGGNFRGNGVELTFLEPLGPRVSLWANGAWNDTKLDLFNEMLFGTQPERQVGGTETLHSYVNPAGRLIGSPAYTANLGVDCKILDHLHFSPALRYFTEQAGVDFRQPVPVFVTVRNRYYLDAALTWTHVWGRDMDLRLSGSNLLDNREPVAAQQLDDLYRPRGIEIVLTAFVRF